MGMTESHLHEHDEDIELDEGTVEDIREIAQSDLSVSECAKAILRAVE